MKYYSRLELYKANNVKYSPNEGWATSYDWWYFLDRLELQDGSTISVFNNYAYSSSTTGHQSKVRRVMRRQPDLRLYLTRKCLRTAGSMKAALSDEIECGKLLLANLERKIASPRTHKKKNEERRAQIKSTLDHIAKVQRVMAKAGFVKPQVGTPLNNILEGIS